MLFWMYHTMLKAIGLLKDTFQRIVHPRLWQEQYRLLRMY